MAQVIQQVDKLRAFKETQASWQVYSQSKYLKEYSE